MELCKCGEPLDVELPVAHRDWVLRIPFTKYTITLADWSKPVYESECVNCMMEKQSRYEDSIGSSGMEIGYERGYADAQRDHW